MGCATAQVTHFSEVTRTHAFDPAFGGGLENQIPLWLPDGNIGMVTTGDGNTLVFQIFSPSGTLLSTYSDPSPTPFSFAFLTGAELTPDQTAIVISGSNRDAFSNDQFYIARLDLSTQETKVAVFPVLNPFTTAPNVNVTAGGINALFPNYRYSIAARYTTDLVPVWATGFTADSIDTLWTKHPSMAGFCDDTTFVVTCKDGSQLGVARLNAATGDVLDYLLYPDSTYTRTYSSTRLQDGNIVLVGRLVTSPFIMKCSYDGTTLFWAKRIIPGIEPVNFFEGVMELPDGRILALCSNAISTRSFNGICTFGTDGNLLEAHILDSPDGAFYNMATPALNEHGILAGGSKTTDWAEVQRLLQYTDFELSQACEVRKVGLLTIDHDFGVPASLSAADVNSWDMPITGVSHTFTLAPTVSENPVACGWVSTSKPHASTHPTISPNPVSYGMDVLLSLGKVSQCSVTLVDAAGRVLRNESFTGSQHLLNTEGLNAGVYMVRVASSDGLIHTQRLLVQ